MYIAATNNGLCFVGSQNQPFEELVKWANHYFPGNDLIQDDENCNPLQMSLLNIFKARLIGSPFQSFITAHLFRKRYGRHYVIFRTAKLDLTRILLNKFKTDCSSGHWEGYWSEPNPHYCSMPSCYRKNGSLTGYRGGMEMKTQLLELERGFTNSGKELQHV